MTYNFNTQIPNSNNLDHFIDTDCQECIRIGTIGLHLKNSWAIKAHFPAIRQLSSHFSIRAVFNKNLDSTIDTITTLKLENAIPYPSIKSFFLSSDINMILISLLEKNYSEIIPDLIKYCRIVNNNSTKNFSNRRIEYILFDWPLNCSIEESEILSKEMSNLGIQTIMSLQGRKSPYILRAKELIAEGSIGSLNSIEVTGNGAWYGYERIIKSPEYLYQNGNGSDLISNSFAHTIDVVQYITGSYFAQINAMIFNNIPEQDLIDENGNKMGEKISMNVPDHLLFQGKLINGNIPVSCSFKGGKPTKKFSKNLVIEIHGTKGDIKLEGDAGFVEMSNLVLYYSGMKQQGKPTDEDETYYEEDKEVMEFYHLRNYNALLGNIFRLYQSIIDLHTLQLQQGQLQPFNIQSFQPVFFPTLNDGLILFKLIKSVFKSHILGSTLDVSNI